MEDQQWLTWLGQIQRQAGVVSRQQALDAGFTEKAIEWRLRRGMWQRLHAGAYATFSGKPSREGKLWAAVLHVGSGAVLSHETAAEIHRLTDKQSTRIHVSVPIERRPGQNTRIRGVVIHRSRGLVAEWQPPWHLPRTTVEDTVLDLIGGARTFDDAYGWISAAVGRRLSTPELLGKALAARSRMRWRGWVTAALSDAADGVHSPLERRYVHGVERAHGLPMASRQARVRQATGNRYLDNLYMTYRACVEIDGAAAHPADEQWRDKGRDRWNAVHEGIETIRVGVLDLISKERQCRTAADVAKWLSGRGPAVGRPCGPGCRVSLVGVVRTEYGRKVHPINFGCGWCGSRVAWGGAGCHAGLR